MKVVITIEDTVDEQGGNQILFAVDAIVSEDEKHRAFTHTPAGIIGISATQLIRSGEIMDLTPRLLTAFLEENDLPLPKTSPLNTQLEVLDAYSVENLDVNKVAIFPINETSQAY